ncbi:MAG: hypothetical protein V4808_07220 [Pseudomonadota bacterium]
MATAPIKWKSKTILVKPEVTYGVDPVPTAANAVLLTDVQFQPMEGEDVTRNVELPYMGAQEAISAGLRAVLTGTFELVGSGETGVAPGWSAIMRSLGVAEVVTPDDDPDDGTVEYVPVSQGHESTAIYFIIGPTRYVMVGCAGTGQMTVNAQGIPGIRATITGLFTLPSDQAPPSVDLSNFVEPQVASKANTPVFTINGIPFVMRNFGFDFGCDVQPRMLVGREQILIVDRAEKITTTVEAVPLATYSPYLKAITPKPRMPIVLQHGTAAGRRVKFEAPTAVQMRPSGFENQQGVLEWPLTFTPLPDEGDDQWKITLS